MRFVSVILAIACLLLLLGINASIDKIHKLEHQLSEKTDEIALLWDKLNQTKVKLVKAQEELNRTRMELSQRIEDLHKDYYILKKNPSYEEVKEMLKSTYITFISDKKPLCAHITFAYWRFLTEHRIFASPVVIYLKYHYGYTGHMILAINTSDRGIVYYDPIEDKFVNISLNNDYYMINGLKSPIGPNYVVDYVHYWDFYPKYSWN